MKQTSKPGVTIIATLSDGSFRGINPAGTLVRVNMNGQGKALAAVVAAHAKAATDGLDLMLDPPVVKVPADWVTEA